MVNWLVVSTALKNISQLGWLFPIYAKITNVPNHQPVNHDILRKTFLWGLWKVPRSSGQNPGKAGPDTAPQTAMAMSSVVLFQLKDVEILGKPKQFIYKTSRLWIFHFQVGSHWSLLLMLLGMAKTWWPLETLKVTKIDQFGTVCAYEA